VPVIAVMLIAAGVVRLCGYLVPWMAGERSLDVGAQQVLAGELEWDRRLFEMQQQGLSPASIVRLREQYLAQQHRLFRIHVARFKASAGPFVRLAVTADILLAGFAIVIGAGLLRGVGWAYRVAVWQALGALMVGLSWITVVPGLSMEWRLLSTLLKGGAEAAPEWLYAPGVLTATTWGGALWLLASNGFIIWQLTREHVRRPGA
jgi:hypothetical protein